MSNYAKLSFFSSKFFTYPEGTYLCPDCNRPRESNYGENGIDHTNCPNYVPDEEDDGE